MDFLYQCAFLLFHLWEVFMKWCWISMCNYQLKEKIESAPIMQHEKRIKYLNKINQRDKSYKLKTSKKVTERYYGIHTNMKGHLWSGILKSIKLLILPQSDLQIKIAKLILQETEKSMLKFIWNLKDLKLQKQSWKERKLGSHTSWL